MSGEHLGGYGLFLRALRANQVHPEQDYDHRRDTFNARSRVTAEGSVATNALPQKTLNPEEIERHRTAAQSHVSRARELNTGTGAPAAEGESVISHLEQAYVEGRTVADPSTKSAKSLAFYLGTVESDRGALEAMGLTAQEYHGIMSDAYVQLAEGNYQQWEGKPGAAPDFSSVYDTVRAYERAGYHAAMAGQTGSVLDSTAAQAQVSAQVDQLAAPQGLSHASLLELRQSEGLAEIRRLLSEAHSVDTRENDLNAAQSIDWIFKNTGLNIHSPKLQANNIDAEEIQGLRATSFGERWNDLVATFVPGFAR